MKLGIINVAVDGKIIIIGSADSKMQIVIDTRFAPEINPMDHALEIIYAKDLIKHLEFTSQLLLNYAPQELVQQRCREAYQIVLKAKGGK